MSYNWQNGEVITAEKLNHIERGVRGVNDSYTPTDWETGDVITAEKLNNIEEGIESAGGVDVSGDTVTADKLFFGATAHNAEGEQITGTLTGEDFFTKSITITCNGVVGILVNAVGNYSDNSFLMGNTIPINTGESKTIPIPRGIFYIAVQKNVSNVSYTFSDLSSGVTIANNGEPITIGTSTVYIISTMARNSPLSFTVTTSSV